MELLSRNPDVVQVHNAFSNSDVAKISGLNVSLGVVNDQIEHRIEQKLEAILGLRTTEPGASDPMELIGHLPGDHAAETSVDFVSSA